MLETSSLLSFVCIYNMVLLINPEVVITRIKKTIFTDENVLRLYMFFCYCWLPTRKIPFLHCSSNISQLNNGWMTKYPLCFTSRDKLSILMHSVLGNNCFEIANWVDVFIGSAFCHILCIHTFAWVCSFV